VPLFFVLQKKTKWKAFFFSYFIGIIFWAGIIYWLVHVTLLGTILLILYLALYFGIFGLIISTTNYGLSTINLVFIPSIWVLLEYIRSHLFTGFPWALLGYSQYLNLPIIQIADITGVWGVSFLVMMVNVLIKQVIGDRLWVVGKRTKNIILLPILLLALSLGYGYYRLYLRPKTYDLRPIRVSVIQGNIPQELKWEINSRDFIMNKYFALTKQAAGDKPDIIIWPEASVPFVLEEEPLNFKRIKDLAKEIKTPLLLGVVTYRDNFYYNSALLVSSDSEILNKYDKLHLVPFGEYIPLKKILPFLETVVPIGDFTAGKVYTVFTQYTRHNTRDTIRFSVLICFEDLFPELSRRFVKRGADFLVNITNDAWYKKTSASYQHLQASVFRAVENRIFLARAANTGVSGFIAPSGKIISLVQERSGKNIFVEGIDTQELPILNKSPSFYTRYGDVFPVACFLIVLYSIIFILKKKQ